MGEGAATLREVTAFVGVHLLDTVPETTAIKTAEGKLKGGEVAAADEPWPLVWLVETSDAATAEALAAGPLGAERLTAQGAAPDAAVGAYVLQFSMDA
jgi:hypothetical protein